MDFLFSYLILVAIYIILSLSTNLLVGIGRNGPPVSQAAVFGVGAYIVGYCLVNDVVSFVPALGPRCSRQPLPKRACDLALVARLGRLFCCDLVWHSAAGDGRLH